MIINWHVDHIENDEQAIDAIATLLGTSADWSADHTEAIANIIGRVRPHPGCYEYSDSYTFAFVRATGRQPDPVWDQVPS